MKISLTFPRKRVIITLGVLAALAIVVIFTAGRNWQYSAEQTATSSSLINLKAKVYFTDNSAPAIGYKVYLNGIGYTSDKKGLISAFVPSDRPQIRLMIVDPNDNQKYVRGNFEGLIYLNSDSAVVQLPIAR